MTKMTSSGPLPKRSDDRIRREEPTVKVIKVNVKDLIDQEVEMPAANEDWHPIALRWYLSLSESAQCVYYEPSDWATAYAIAETMSRELQPQIVATIQANESFEGRVIREKVPVKGASLNAMKAFMTNLLVTEGDRRRAGMEIIRESQSASVEDAADAKVMDMEEERRRLAGNA